MQGISSARPHALYGTGMWLSLLVCIARLSYNKGFEIYVPGEKMRLDLMLSLDFSRKGLQDFNLQVAAEGCKLWLAQWKGPRGRALGPTSELPSQAQDRIQCSRERNTEQGCIFTALLRDGKPGHAVCVHFFSTRSGNFGFLGCFLLSQLWKFLDWAPRQQLWVPNGVAAAWEGRPQQSTSFPLPIPTALGGIPE